MQLARFGCPHRGLREKEAPHRFYRFSVFQDPLASFETGSNSDLKGSFKKFYRVLPFELALKPV